MANVFTLIKQLLNPRAVDSTAEVDRIHVLQQAAAARRAEYAQKQEQAGKHGDASAHNPDSTSWKRLKEAESAHIAALQKWENKQARQKSH